MSCYSGLRVTNPYCGLNGEMGNCSCGLATIAAPSFQLLLKGIRLLMAQPMLLKLVMLIRNTNEHITKRNFCTVTGNRSISKGIKVPTKGENTHDSNSLLSPHKLSKSSASYCRVTNRPSMCI